MKFLLWFRNLSAGSSAHCRSTSHSFLPQHQRLDCNPSFHVHSAIRSIICLLTPFIQISSSEYFEFVLSFTSRVCEVFLEVSLSRVVRTRSFRRPDLRLRTFEVGNHQRKGRTQRYARTEITACSFVRKSLDRVIESFVPLLNTHGAHREPIQSLKERGKG